MYEKDNSGKRGRLAVLLLADFFEKTSSLSSKGSESLWTVEWKFIPFASTNARVWLEIRGINVQYLTVSRKIVMDVTCLGSRMT